MLYFICDVTQLFGDVLARRLTVRAGHFTTEIINTMNRLDINLSKKSLDKTRNLKW